VSAERAVLVGATFQRDPTGSFAWCRWRVWVRREGRGGLSLREDDEEGDAVRPARV